MKGLAAILALFAATVATAEGNERPSSCDMDRGEPVCLDKMASYSACLGPELAARFSAAALECHFGGNDEESDEEDVVDSDESSDSEESDEEDIVPSERQRPGKGKGKKGKGKKGRPGKGKGGKGSSSSEEEDDDIFDIVNFVRNDVEERTCVYRAMGWVCEESGEVDVDKMREDIP